FGTTGSAGKTSEQHNALSTDDLIKHLNDTLTSGASSLSQTAFGIGNFKTEASALLNSIRDTTHAKGSKDYQPGMLDRVEERLIKTADDINSVADEAMQTTDPKRLNELLARMTELQIEFKRVLKEQEKLEAIARLVTQLMMGCPTAGAIKALQDMGLGALVVDLLRAFVASMRKQGKMSPQIIAVLQAAGYGELVAFDDAALKRDKAIQDQATLDDLATPTALTDAQAGSAALAASPDSDGAEVPGASVATTMNNHGNLPDTRTGGQSTGATARATARPT
ncbi:MAG: hypothetical protein H7123_01245, partial [Thermoleophilia bacterium]|nr:hypothetical protein [Thermoleophilia bacterium]